MKKKLWLVIGIAVALLAFALYRVVTESIRGSYVVAVDRTLARSRNRVPARKVIVDLASMGEPAVEPLIAHLADRDVYNRWAAETALVKMGAPAVKPLTKALGKDRPYKTRLAAARALGKFRDERAIDPLISTLGDKSHQLGYAAALALWNKGPEATRRLISALRDRDPAVRANAASALGGMGDKTACMPLIQALTDSDKEVRTCAAEALGYAGDKRSETPLLAVFQDHKEYRDARMAAGRSLRYVNDSLAVRAAIGVLWDKTDNPDLRWIAAEILAYSHNPRAQRVFKAALSDRDPDVRDAAGSYLGRQP